MRVMMQLIGWAMIAATAVAAAEEPAVVRWGGGASPNMVSAARNLPEDPGKTTPAWEIRVGTHQYSIPTIDRGRIYVGANDMAVDRPGYKRTAGGSVMCVEQATGKMIWRLPIPRFMGGIKPPYHFDQWRCGVCSGPVADENRVYVIGNRGEILCLDREGQANGNDGPFVDELKYMDLATTAGTALESTDGDIIWKYNLIEELDVVLHDVCGSTLLMVGDYLYACTSNGIDDRHNKVPRPDAPTLIVIDKRTGRLVARDDEKIGHRLLHCNWSSPSAGEVDGKTLIFFGGGDGLLYAFKAVEGGAEETKAAGSNAAVKTLEKVWAVDCNPPDYRFRDGKPVPHSTNSKPTPDGASEVIGAPVFYQGRVYAAIGQSPVYGVGCGNLCCVDAATGKVVWASKLVERTLATPAIADGLLYIPDLPGNLHCFEAASGERCWMHDLEGKTWHSSAFVADGKVYVGTENSNLWTLKAGKTKKILSRMKLKSPPMTLVADDGVLCIPTQLSLAAIPGNKR